MATKPYVPVNSSDLSLHSSHPEAAAQKKANSHFQLRPPSVSTRSKDQIKHKLRSGNSRLAERNKFGNN